MSRPVPPAPTRDAALAYARRGWRVFPLFEPSTKGCSCGKADCDRAAKHPRTKHGLKDATTDEKQILDWWSKWPSANVGIATGQGLLVIDIDVAAGGTESMARLVEEHGRLPPTPVVQTGGGGWHYLLRAEDGLRNSQGKLGRGVDVRADGGYVVAAPSLHASGATYSWVKARSPDEVEVAEAPAWLVALLRPPPRALPSARPLQRDDVASAYRRAQAYLAKLPPSIQGQNGSGALWTAAQAMVRGFCLPAADALEILAVDFNPRCEPPWSDRELEHKVADAANKSQLPDGYLLDAQRPEFDRTPRLHAVPPEPPPPTDADAPASLSTPAVSMPPPPASASNVTPIRPTTSGNAALAPAPELNQIVLTKSYASICQILRTPSLRARILGDGELEFNEQSLEPTIGRRPIADHMVSSIRERCEHEFTSKNKGIQFSRGDIEQAVLQVAHEKPFHPVLEYLRPLAWDGQSRINEVAARILGIPSPSTITRRILRNFFIASVARAMKPGCKVDNVLTFVGTEGRQKSAFFRTLAGNLGFSDTAIDMHDKDAKLVLRRVWIYEWAELDAVQRARSPEGVKAFITSQIDTIRPPYGRGIQEFPRTCMLVGTTNKPRFLAASNGDRRWWPVTITSEINLDLLARWRDQLWAEARAAYDAGEHWWLSGADEAELSTEKESYREIDPWEAPILTWMQDRFNTYDADAPTSADIMVGALGRPAGQATRADENRIAGLLDTAGYKHRRVMVKGVRAWRWYPTDNQPAQLPLGGGE